MTNLTTRRRALALLGLGAAGAALAACGGAASPTAAPTKPAAAPPTTAPAANAPTAPAATTAPAAATKPAASAQGVGLIKGPFEGEARALTGAGATFPAPLYTKWFEEYNKLTQVKVNYQSIGSGGGIKSISDGTVDFGATDGPMTDEQMKATKGEILHIPMTIGGVAVTYNLPGVNDPLKFTGETLPAIYLGTITKWNDPKLVADNPALKDVNKDIVVVQRSDGSGTTYAFSDYLSSVSADWKSKVGTATAVKWPVGLGGKGNEGVAGEVKQNQYSIGYVEVIYALQNKLGVAQMKNKAGKWVEPKLDGVTAAAAGVADNMPADMRASIVNAAGEAAYPISTFTWLLAYKQMTDKPKAIALTRLMWWNIHDGQTFCQELGYAPLPEPVARKCEEKIQLINVDAQKAFPGA
ncbi:MAG TPA: phosphate ABC transporter substrate-binding protein PstS [Chloroflexota bacterium]|jgi:phosphate transport system substrate-binding protein